MRLTSLAVLTMIALFGASAEPREKEAESNWTIDVGVLLDAALHSVAVAQSTVPGVDLRAIDISAESLDLRFRVLSKSSARKLRVAIGLSRAIAGVRKGPLPRPALQADADKWIGEFKIPLHGSRKRVPSSPRSAGDKGSRVIRRAFEATGKLEGVTTRPPVISARLDDGRLVARCRVDIESISIAYLRAALATIHIGIGGLVSETSLACLAAETDVLTLDRKKSMKVKGFVTLEWIHE